MCGGGGEGGGEAWKQLRCASAAWVISMLQSETDAVCGSALTPPTPPPSPPPPPPRTHAGNMSAKPCSGGQTVLNLWASPDTTGRQLFEISGVAGGGGGALLATNATLVNVGRTREGCAGYVGVASATAGQCSNTGVLLLGSRSGLGAASWSVQNVTGEPGYVYITNAVRVRIMGGVCVWGGGYALLLAHAL